MTIKHRLRSWKTWRNSNMVEEKLKNMSHNLYLLTSIFLQDFSRNCKLGKALMQKANLQDIFSHARLGVCKK